MLTNVPQRLLSSAAAFALLRARWQIELLWKRWKDQGKIDEWQTANPARILCELYAKLLGMLVHDLVGHLPLSKALSLLTQAVRGGCSIPKCHTRLSTSHRLLQFSDDGLT